MVGKFKTALLHDNHMDAYGLSFPFDFIVIACAIGAKCLCDFSAITNLYLELASDACDYSLFCVDFR